MKEQSVHLVIGLPEVTEPNFSERHDGSVWARTPYVQAELISQVARSRETAFQAGEAVKPIDFSLALQGMGANLILDDDVNALLPVLVAREMEQLDPSFASYTAEQTNKAFQDLQVRLDFEMQTGLPDEVQLRLLQTRELLVSESKGKTEEKFERVYDHWRDLQGWVREEVEQNPELQRARIYASSVLREIQTDYGQVLMEGMQRLSA